MSAAPFEVSIELWLVCVGSKARSYLRLLAFNLVAQGGLGR